MVEGFTKGPWELRGPRQVYGNLQRDQNWTGDLVATIVSDWDGPLIAAAPDLFEALEDLERAIAMERAGVESDLDGWMDAFDSVEACRERAHAALSKARSTPPTGEGR